MTAGVMNVIEQAGEAVLLLCEDVQPEALLNSRITRAEVVRQLQMLARGLGSLDTGVRETMPELDWDAWAHVVRMLDADRPQQDEVLWFAVRSLVPATLSWLRVYRGTHRQLFELHSAN